MLFTLKENRFVHHNKVPGPSPNPPPADWEVTLDKLGTSLSGLIDQLTNLTTEITTFGVDCIGFLRGAGGSVKNLYKKLTKPEEGPRSLTTEYSYMGSKVYNFPTTKSLSNATQFKALDHHKKIALLTILIKDLEGFAMPAIDLAGFLTKVSYESRNSDLSDEISEIDDKIKELQGADLRTNEPEGTNVSGGTDITIAELKSIRKIKEEQLLSKMFMLPTFVSKNREFPKGSGKMVAYLEVDFYDLQPANIEVYIQALSDGYLKDIHKNLAMYKEELEKHTFYRDSLEDVMENNKKTIPTTDYEKEKNSISIHAEKQMSSIENREASHRNKIDAKNKTADDKRKAAEKTRKTNEENIRKAQEIQNQVDQDNATDPYLDLLTL